jgi:hypothetical protein
VCGGGGLLRQEGNFGLSQLPWRNADQCSLSPPLRLVVNREGEQRPGEQVGVHSPGIRLTCWSMRACCCWSRACSCGGDRICWGVSICCDIMATDTGTCGICPLARSGTQSLTHSVTKWLPLRLLGSHAGSATYGLCLLGYVTYSQNGNSNCVYLIRVTQRLIS